VKNVVESVKTAQGLGGTVLVPPKPELFDNRVALVADPTGAAIGLLEWSEVLLKEKKIMRNRLFPWLALVLTTMGAGLLAGCASDSGGTHITAHPIDPVHAPTVSTADAWAMIGTSGGTTKVQY
jgi:hypothetical protein